MTKIITIEREYGTGAGAISRQLTSALGWNLWDCEISEEIARKLKTHVSTVESCTCFYTDLQRTRSAA